MFTKEIIKIGTRGSRLALIQTDMVIARLKEKFPSVSFEKTIITTRGDIVTDRPIYEIDNGNEHTAGKTGIEKPGAGGTAGKKEMKYPGAGSTVGVPAGEKVLETAAPVSANSVFTSAIEDALKAGAIDMAVHSGKDLPSRLEEPLSIAAVLKRSAANDVLIATKGKIKLPGQSGQPDEFAYQPVESICRSGSSGIAAHSGGLGLTVGTSSPRRMELCSKLMPGCGFVNMRGNVPTRLDKLRKGLCGATVLAEAGLRRLGAEIDLAGLDILRLDPESFVPAASQGIIVCEALKGSRAESICRAINDARTMLIFEAERKVMELIGSSCHDAAGVYGRFVSTAGGAAARNSASGVSGTKAGIGASDPSGAAAGEFTASGESAAISAIDEIFVLSAFYKKSDIITVESAAEREAMLDAAARISEMLL